MSENETQLVPTSTHWGNYRVEVVDDTIKAIHPYMNDLDPTPLSQSLKDSRDPRVRVAQPMVRAGYLESSYNSDRTQRGREPFVAISWEDALDLVAKELKRVIERHGNSAIFAGAYGWASSGTLHFPRWNMHCLLNLLGGFTDAIGSYSTAAFEAIAPHIIASDKQLKYDIPSWHDIAKNAELVVLFGGASLKNAHVGYGGLGPHTAKADMHTAVKAGITFINISPIREDVDPAYPSEWHAARPNTDTAIMLGMAHTLVTENLVDEDFIKKYTVGYGQFLPYLLGQQDGQPKDADWAAGISEMAAEDIRRIARNMAAKKTLIGVSWSIQRAEHGEQPYWMGIVLACLLGEVGQPGRGIALGLNALHSLGSAKRPLTGWPVRPVGTNPTQFRIPVARVADMLLNPGKPFQYNGHNWTYPDIRLVYWVGGNPFHHHQDINRFIRAWQQPETIIVNEPFWTPTARFADIVLPANTGLERNDINFTLLDATISPNRQAVSSFGQSRSDFEIFLDLAKRLGVEEGYSEGRDEMGWLRHFYEQARQLAEAQNQQLPDFESFWLGEPITLEQREHKVSLLERFRADPEAASLGTPSGKIEIFSQTIANFGYEDCLGHPAWLPPKEWLGHEYAQQYPLHLMSNQPKTRLHSQLDHACVSRDGKIQQREPARMNKTDAIARNIKEGDIIKVFNDRGACLTVIQLSDDIRPGVIQLPTGAWYNPSDPHKAKSLEIHGNPNVLTRDVGTSKLGQGPSPNSTLVEVEKFMGELPPITVHDLPEILSTPRVST
ncbi:MAG: molybdopterin-dependent oxidoreductase [Chloroflexota bacterium]